MPKELFEAKMFLPGTITNPSEADVPNEATPYSLNVNPSARDGIIEPIDKDLKLTTSGFASSGTEVTGTNGKVVAMGMINKGEVAGERTLIVCKNDKLTAVENVYSATPTNTSFDITTNSDDYERKITVNVNNTAAHIGIGGEINMKPKWLGYIDHSQFGQSPGETIILEDDSLKSTSLMEEMYSIAWLPSDPDSPPTSIDDGNVFGIKYGGNYLYKFNAGGGFLEDVSGVLQNTKGLAKSKTDSSKLWLFSAVGDNGTVYSINTETLTVDFELTISDVNGRFNMEKVSDIIHHGYKLWFAYNGSFTEAKGEVPQDDFLYRSHDHGASLPTSGGTLEIVDVSWGIINANDARGSLTAGTTINGYSYPDPFPNKNSLKLASDSFPIEILSTTNAGMDIEIDQGEFMVVDKTLGILFCTKGVNRSNVAVGQWQMYDIKPLRDGSGEALSMGEEEGIDDAKGLGWLALDEKHQIIFVASSQAHINEDGYSNRWYLDDTVKWSSNINPGYMGLTADIGEGQGYVTSSPYQDVAYEVLEEETFNGIRVSRIQAADDDSGDSGRYRICDVNNPDFVYETPAHPGDPSEVVEPMGGCAVDPYHQVVFTTRIGKYWNIKYGDKNEQLLTVIVNDDQRGEMGWEIRDAADNSLYHTKPMPFNFAYDNVGDFEMFLPDGEYKFVAWQGTDAFAIWSDDFSITIRDIEGNTIFSLTERPDNVYHEGGDEENIYPFTVDASGDAFPHTYHNQAVCEMDYRVDAPAGEITAANISYKAGLPAATYGRLEWKVVVDPEYKMVFALGVVLNGTSSILKVHAWDYTKTGTYPYSNTDVTSMNDLPDYTLDIPHVALTLDSAEKSLAYNSLEIDTYNKLLFCGSQYGGDEVGGVINPVIKYEADGTMTKVGAMKELGGTLGETVTNNEVFSCTVHLVDTTKQLVISGYGEVRGIWLYDNDGKMYFQKEESVNTGYENLGKINALNQSAIDELGGNIWNISTHEGSPTNGHPWESYVESYGLANTSGNSIEDSGNKPAQITIPKLSLTITDDANTIAVIHQQHELVNKSNLFCHTDEATSTGESINTSNRVSTSDSVAMITLAGTQYLAINGTASKLKPLGTDTQHGNISSVFGNTTTDHESFFYSYQDIDNPDKSYLVAGHTIGSLLPWSSASGTVLTEVGKSELYDIAFMSFDILKDAAGDYLVHSFTGDDEGAGYLNKWGTSSISSGTFSELILNSQSFLQILTAWNGTGDGNWTQNETTVFHKTSFLYDGYQESPLSTDFTTLKPNDISDGVNDLLEVTIDLRNLSILSKRISHLNIYRATVAYDASDLVPEPDGLYRLVKSIPLDGRFVIDDSDPSLRSWDFIDIKGSETASYDAITGISQETTWTSVNYSISTTVNNELIVGRCWHLAINDAWRYLFKSKPYKYSQFDWTTDYLRLPSLPTALVGFNGRCYAFDENTAYVINTQGFYIEDTYEGVGCMNDHCHVVTEYGVFFADQNNIYHHDGKNPKSIGDRILRSEDGKVGWHDKLPGDNNNLGISAPSVQFDAKTNTVMVLFHDGNNTHKIWAYNMMRDRWDLWEGAEEMYSAAPGRDGEVLISTDSGIYAYNRDESSQRDLTWHSKKWAMGTVTQNKKFKKVKWDGTVGTPTVEVDGTVCTLDLVDEPVGSAKITSNNTGKNIKMLWNAEAGKIDSLGIIYRRKSIK